MVKNYLLIGILAFQATPVFALAEHLVNEYELKEAFINQLYNTEKTFGAAWSAFNQAVPRRTTTFSLRSSRSKLDETVSTITNSIKGLEKNGASYKPDHQWFDDDDDVNTAPRDLDDLCKKFIRLTQKINILHRLLQHNSITRIKDSLSDTDRILFEAFET